MYILAHRWTGFQTSLSNQWIRRQINVDWLNQKRLSISCGSVIGLQCYIDMEAFFLCRPPWYRTRVQCYFSNQWLLSRRDNRLVGNGFGNSHSGNRNLSFVICRHDFLRRNSFIFYTSHEVSILIVLTQEYFIVLKLSMICPIFRIGLCVNSFSEIFF